MLAIMQASALAPGRGKAVLRASQGVQDFSSHSKPNNYVSLSVSPKGKAGLKPLKLQVGNGDSPEMWDLG